MLGFAKKLFGSSNDRKVKTLTARVAKINALEPEYAALSDEALKAKTAEFKDRLAKGATLDDVLNEAFAAQALAVTQQLGLDPAKVNPNGSGISLGHPIGATGALIAVKALYELQRTGGRYALVTMCIGGGQGIAAIFERL